MQKEKRNEQRQRGDDERQRRNQKKGYDRNLSELRNKDVQDFREGEVAFLCSEKF